MAEEDKKLGVLKSECRSANPNLTGLIEKVYLHAKDHPNQERDAMAYEIKKLVDSSIGS